MQYDAEIMLAFVEEIAEYVPQLRTHLGKLATNPRHKESLEEAYRLAHTIKGSAAMVELDQLSAEGRGLEEALLPVVEKKASFTPALATKLLGRVDRVESLITVVRAELENEDEVAVVPPAPSAELYNLAPPPPPPPARLYEQFSPPLLDETPTTVVVGLPEEAEAWSVPAWFEPNSTPRSAASGELPPPPPSYLYAADELAGYGSAPNANSLPPLPPPPPSYLYDLEPPSSHQARPVPLPPPPPPKMTAPVQHGLDFDLPPVPPSQPFSGRLSLPPVPPAKPLPDEADLDLTDLFTEPNDLQSLDELFAAELPPSLDAALPPPPDYNRVLGDTPFALDWSSYEPDLGEEKISPVSSAPAPASKANRELPGLTDALTARQVDADISLLQNEILDELPPHLAALNGPVLPGESGPNEAELPDLLHRPVTPAVAVGSGRAVEKSLNGLENPALLPELSGPLSVEELAELSVAEPIVLPDFTAAADLLASLDGNYDFEGSELEAVSFDFGLPSLDNADTPTAPAVASSTLDDYARSAGFSSSSVAQADFDFDSLAQTLDAGELDDQASATAALAALRGLPSLDNLSPDLDSISMATPPGFLTEAEAEEEAAIAAAISAMAENGGVGEFGEAEFGGFEAETSDSMGAFFLAEAQGDLAQLQTLVTQFDRPGGDKTGEAAQIARICGTLRKAAVMMDLEEIARQVSVLENRAAQVAAGALPLDPHTPELLAESLAHLTALLAPYEAAAASLFAVPAGAEAQSSPPQPLSPTVAPPVRAEIAVEGGSAASASTAVATSKTSSTVISTTELDPELAEVFASEAQEHIQNLDVRLAALEHDPRNRELLREIRRTAHTLKGSAAMVGLKVISQTGHLMEDLLDRLYDGTLAVDEEVVELLFVTFNAIDAMVRGLAVGQAESDEFLEVLRPRYNLLLEGAGAEEATAVAETPSGAIIFARKTQTGPLQAPAQESLRRVEAAEVEALEAALAAAETDAEEAGTDADFEAAVHLETDPASARPLTSLTQLVRPSRPAPNTALDLELAVRVPIKRLDTMVNQIGELVINRTVLERRQQILNRSVDELGLSIKRLQRVTRELETRYEVELLKNEAVPVGIGTRGADDRPAYENRLLEGGRAEFDTLEMDRYTEFHTLSREMTETVDDLAAALRELNTLNEDLENALIQQARLTDDLQDRVVKVRLVPVSNLTPRLYRTVRSLVSLQGKEIEFVVSGESTQIDKSISEELGDPLLHLVRNAIDHGLETPDERERLGKPRTATLTFAARTEGSQVVIEVRDDGRGIDLAAVQQKGVERGLLPAGAEVSEEELYDLLFVPGFSTSQTITDISGRGVGLDVVRANIARLKGTVEVESAVGRGTTFIIRLPSTLAITRALLVRVGGYTYAVPLAAIERTIRPEREAIEDYGTRRYYRLEDTTVPLLDLNSLLHLHPHQRRAPDEEDVTTRSQFASRRERPLLLINGPERAVVRVDSLIGQQEVVVKPLGSHLKAVPGVTGATLLGSGEVILILNVYELVATATGRRSRYGLGSRSLPAPVRPARPDEERPEVPAPRPRVPLIQVVDDSLSVRKVLSAALEKSGFRVRTSKDGQEALEMVQQVPPDLIVMDIEMPRMDGYELTALLKSRESYRRIPIVMLTSRAGLKHRQKAEEVGADGFLVKPYREQELLQIVSTLLVQARL